MNNAVPLDEATAHDFMQIRAALVRRLGSANSALVWSRVYYRARVGNPFAYEHEGAMWWRANRDIVAEETGLNPGQARRTLETLVEEGYLIAEKHHRDGNYDQTKSYRCNVVDSADDWAPATNEDRASATNLHRSPPTNPSSIKKSQEGEEETLAHGDAVGVLGGIEVESTDEVLDSFVRVWAAWPRSESKKSALTAYRKAARAVSMVALERATIAWAEGMTGVIVGAADPAEAKQRTPYLASWLNAERWIEAPPVPPAPRTNRGEAQRHDLAAIAAQMDAAQQPGIGAGMTTREIHA